MANAVCPKIETHALNSGLVVYSMPDFDVRGYSVENKNSGLFVTFLAKDSNFSQFDDASNAAYWVRGQLAEAYVQSIKATPSTEGMVTKDLYDIATSRLAALKKELTEMLERLGRAEAEVKTKDLQLVDAAKKCTELASLKSVRILGGRDCSGVWAKTAKAGLDLEKHWQAFADELNLRCTCEPMTAEQLREFLYGDRSVSAWVLEKLESLVDHIWPKQQTVDLRKQVEWTKLNDYAWEAKHQGRAIVLVKYTGPGNQRDDMWFGGSTDEYVGSFYGTFELGKEGVEKFLVKQYQEKGAKA